MQLILEQDTLDRIEGAITANRQAAGELVPSMLAGDVAASERMNQLNEAWCKLEEAKTKVTGKDFAPYRMGRR